jgi:hypothetical protein
MSDQDQRIRRLEDRAELQDLVVRYFLAADDDDYPALGETFARESTFTAGGFEGGKSRSEIVEFIRADRRNMGPTIHTYNYSLFSFKDDDHASGVVGAHLELSRGGSSLYGAVRYLDDYVREDGRWRIQHRNMLAIHVGPWEQVATSLTSELRVRWPGAAPQRADLPKA